ncbi:hypothetical protein Kisp02_50010 [Kineosporia sp. NBRC 101731]|nr:hypothetical protein Kisp02_50010 [Kineosporia sp. NBRC 101731]
MQEYGDGGANLVASCGETPSGRVLYSHLDTSLNGSLEDAVVTGRTDPPGPLRIGEDGTVDGFGLGVARGPAAAALVGFVESMDFVDFVDAAPHVREGATLLLAGSGTHRLLPGETTGVEAYLAAHEHPRQAIIAKAGPPAVLHSEPGAAYLTVRVEGRQGAVLARRFHRPEGGVLAHTGRLIDAIEAWRVAHLARRTPSRIGAEVGIGHLRSGLVTKPDLIPAVLELGLYLVTIPGDRVPDIGRDLENTLRAVAPEGCTVRVDHHEIHAAGLTDDDAPIVRRARAVRERYLGPEQSVTGWTGSTDGVVLRGHGIDTVRLGPTIAPLPEDRRRDRTTLDHLVLWSQIYRDLLTQT